MSWGRSEYRYSEQRGTLIGEPSIEVSCFWAEADSIVGDSSGPGSLSWESMVSSATSVGCLQVRLYSLLERVGKMALRLLTVPSDISLQEEVQPYLKNTPHLSQKKNHWFSRKGHGITDYRSSLAPATRYFYRWMPGQCPSKLEKLICI